MYDLEAEMQLLRDAVAETEAAYLEAEKNKEAAQKTLGEIGDENLWRRHALTALKI
jgi:hypothetical protein